MEPAIIWIFSVVIGAAIGVHKGRLASGLVWSIVFGPLGVLVMLCLKNYREEKRQAEEMEMMLLSRVPPVANEAHGETIRVALDGKDLGEMDMPALKLMLRSGADMKKMQFWSQSKREWLPIALHPSV